MYWHTNRNKANPVKFYPIKNLTNYGRFLLLSGRVYYEVEPYVALACIRLKDEKIFYL